MIGRFRERQYQQTAQKRNDAILKHDNHLQTARYFELECDKARRFNSWNSSPSRKHSEICKKADSLLSRREKLRELLNSEEKILREDCERTKSRNTVKPVNFSFESFNDRLTEKRAEDSLYHPRTCRRIESHLYGVYSPRTNSPGLTSILKESNRRTSRRYNEPTMMSGDRMHSRTDDQLDHDQQDYNKRHDEYKENSRSARASNLYGPDNESEKRHLASSNNKYRPAAGLSTNSADQRPHTRRLHDSHFLLGNQTYLQEEGGAHKGPNQKFTERYANRSLETTNVGETAAHSMDEPEDAIDAATEADIIPENADESQQTMGDRSWRGLDNRDDHGNEGNREKRETTDDNDENGARGSGSSVSMNDNASVESGTRNLDDVAEQTDEIDRNEQRDIDREFDAKISAGRSDRRHFETEKSLPWLRMIPGDKNLSEQMFLYLTHNELKGRIQDLEKRENQAASKHQWDEALRLRDMRNRLDLAREKNLYRRDDLLLDPEIKKIGMAGIEARSILLKEREKLCTNSSMYSEEAKVMWSQWLVEDQNSVLEGARHQREDLMKQLEENWRSLAIEDKQRISDSFNKEIIDIALQNDNDNLCAVRSASR